MKTQYVNVDFQNIDESKAFDKGTLRGIVNQLKLVLANRYHVPVPVSATAKVVQDKTDSDGKTVPKLQLLWKGELANDDITAVGEAIARYLELLRQDVIPLGTDYTEEQEHSP